MSEFPTTELNKIRRKPDRGKYDRETIYQIIDEALICYVGFVENGQPYVLPTIHARVGDTIYLHGSKKSRMLLHLQKGARVCITTALIDGIVFARSVFDHSLNYRSVTLFGNGHLVDSEAEKDTAFQAIVEHIAKGRWEDARQPSRKEMNATTIIAVPIESASAKIRSGPAIDVEEDYGLPIWAGVLPLVLESGSPQPDSRLQEGIEIPKYVSSYHRQESHANG